MPQPELDHAPFDDAPTQPFATAIVQRLPLQRHHTNTGDRDGTGAYRLPTGARTAPDARRSRRRRSLLIALWVLSLVIARSDWADSLCRELAAWAEGDTSWVPLPRPAHAPRSEAPTTADVYDATPDPDEPLFDDVEPPPDAPADGA